MSANSIEEGDAVLFNGVNPHRVGWLFCVLLGATVALLGVSFEPTCVFFFFFFKKAFLCFLFPIWLLFEMSCRQLLRLAYS